MTNRYLFNRAYTLCMRFNSHVIEHDLAYMTESELAGIINFLLQLQSS